MRTNGEANTGNRPRSRARLPLYVGLAYAISIVCGLGLALTALVFFDIRPDHAFSIKGLVVGLIVSALAYASGGFVLGTLSRGLMRTWPTALVYITPSALLQLGMFASAFVNEAVRDDLVTKPWNKIVLPILQLGIAPLVAFYSIRMGEESGDEYDRPNSVLNIPWYHWFWILPFYLFAVVGVPSFLLLTLWWIDLLTADVWPSLLNLPSFIPRIIVFFILMGVCLSIFSVYSTLSERDAKRGPLTVLKVLGHWLLLNALEIVIVLACIGKFMK